MTNPILVEHSLLKDDIRTKFRTMFLTGMEVKDICAELNIPIGTYNNYIYTNKNGWRDFMLETKKEYTLQEVEKITKKILAFDTDEISDKKLAIQQKEAEFLRETLGKDIFSKRIETIGMNVVKTEPLDEDQQKKLDKILGKKEVVDVTPKEEPVIDVSFQEVENDPNIQE